ncbi:hypothetical protein Emag_000170 [Eimeria magna]
MEAQQVALPSSGDGCSKEGADTADAQMSLQHCVVEAFWRCFTTKQNDLTLAAVHALAAVVHTSKAKTVLELFVHLRAAAEAIEEYASREEVSRYMAKRTNVKRLTTLPLRSACSLYQQFAVKHYERKPEISVMEFKSLLIAQSAKFASRISQSKQTIADLESETAWGDEEEVLKASLTACGIPCVLATVGSVARLMARVDLVVVGTEAVAESGGIINRVRL